MILCVTPPDSGRLLFAPKRSQALLLLDCCVPTFQFLMLYACDCITTCGVYNLYCINLPSPARAMMIRRSAVSSRVTYPFQRNLRRALALLECKIPTGMSRGWYSCRQTTRTRGDCYDVKWRNGLKHIDDLAGFCQGNRQKHLSLCLERSRRGYTSGELLPAIRIVGVHVAMFVIIYRSS